MLDPNDFFILSAFATLSYFLFAKRTFDLFSTLYFGCLVYFIPSFSGYVQEFNRYGSMVIGKLYYETYIVNSSILLFITLFALLFDAVIRKRIRRLSLPFLDGPKTSFYAATISVYLSVGFFVLYIVNNPLIFKIFDRSKLVDHFGIIHTLWTTLAAISVVTNTYSRRLNYALIPAATIIFDLLWLGNRETFAATFIALAVLETMRRGPHRLIKNTKTIFYSSCVGVFLFVIKHTYIFIKTGNIGRVLENITDPYFYFRAVLLGEPAVNQAVLDKVLQTDFNVPFSSVYEAPLMFTPAHRSLFDFSPTSFQDLYKPVLFPNVSKGMSANIWSQMMALGEYKMLLLFLFALMSFLALLELMWVCFSRGYFLKCLVGYYSFYICFFINRSDLLYLFSRTRIVILVGLVVFTLAIVARSFRPS